ncbi:hypothetical protein [Rubritalea profundi]|uniref:hypothetical protein n=1 Tax=Rubritalea profundi TaxID=1658618 RepID=UPI00101AE5E9|nr:hypothetical protein [Rubritalea profundi]
MQFDTIITRRGTGSIKWDRRPELDPFWVADMDFMSPPSILDAVQQRLSHGILGYAQAHEGITEAVLDYLQNRHGASSLRKNIGASRRAGPGSLARGERIHRGW